MFIKVRTGILLIARIPMWRGGTTAETKLSENAQKEKRDAFRLEKALKLSLLTDSCFLVQFLNNIWERNFFHRPPIDPLNSIDPLQS